MLEGGRPAEDVAVEADGSASECNFFGFGDWGEDRFRPAVDAFVDCVDEAYDVA